MISFVVKGCSADRVCRHLDTKGMAMRRGYHCAQRWFALSESTVQRPSLAPYNTDADVDALLEGVADLVGKSRPQPQAATPDRSVWLIYIKADKTNQRKELFLDWPNPPPIALIQCV